MCENHAQDVVTQIPYLSRDDLYSHVKPFGADFPDTIIYDVRGREQPSLDKQGFCFVKAKTGLNPSDVSNTRTVAMNEYLLGIEQLLYEKFPQYDRIEVMDFQVRKRAAGFPDQIGAQVDYEQPAAMPHTDFSVDGAFMRMSEAFPGQSEHYRNRSFDLINVWRVLCGPNDDWPLALCDYQSVDIGNDIVENDCLHQTRVGENWLLHANAEHRWYYMSRQMPSDLIVFRNTDSEGVRPRAFHVAFNNPATYRIPRHSIEVRVVAFR